MKVIPKTLVYRTQYFCLTCFSVPLLLRPLIHRHICLPIDFVDATIAISGGSSAIPQKEADIDLVKVDIRSALYEDEINLDAVNELIDRKYETKKSKSKQAVSTLAQLKKILSKDQMDKIKNFKRKNCPAMSEG